MDSAVTDALRRAASLTRAGRPFEATRAIRAALSGGAGPQASEPAAGRTSALPHGKPVLPGATAGQAGQGPSSGAADRAANPAKPTADLRRAAADFVRPLSDTIRDLAAMRRVMGAAHKAPAGPPPVAAGARYLSRTFACPQGQRDYRVYVPVAATEGRATGLVMMLHGCKQDPDDFATGTGMNAKADASGMIVVYPAQAATANATLCWNWFSASDQRRGAGEAALLAALAAEVAAEFAVPPGAVFVAGLSAGGAMAAILAEAYPDVFSAAGIHSGLRAGAASDMPSAFAAMAGRGAAAPASAPEPATRLIVFHGTEDAVVRPSNADAIVAGARLRAGTVERHDGRTAEGRTFQRLVYRTAGDFAQAEHWILHGHGHAWSGGSPDGSYTDQDGPDASAEMMRFFSETAAR